MIYQDVYLIAFRHYRNKNRTAEQHGTMGVSSAFLTGNVRCTSGYRIDASHENGIRTHDNEYS